MHKNTGNKNAKKPNPRTEVVAVRVTKAEKRRILAAAKKDGISASAWILNQISSS